jgi:plasmid stability protein
MRTLEIPNLSDELYQQIEKLAQLRGRSISEQATEFLARGVATDEARQAALLEEIRADRRAMAERGVWITDGDIRAARNWGRE